jgi:Xaa-Pro aminopeptidase
MLTTDTLFELQRALIDANLDGWLLYDFRGLNPIAAELMGLEGLTTRRAFAFVPARGLPIAFTHAIEQGPWHRWPSEWPREIYASWRTLESLLDRVPAGVIEMVRASGATVVSSGDLVTRFYAAWSVDNIASHERAAEVIAGIARKAMAFAGERARTAEPLAEHELMSWIQDEFRRSGLSTDHGPNVSAGANAANPHYEPSADSPRVIRPGEILLIDLWAREEGGVYADQTWMASVGKPSADTLDIWNAVRDARDAAILLVRERAKANVPTRGAEVDDAARRVIQSRGFGDYFTHRTGHSIDPRDLHGSGPHLDNLETREERLLVPGIGFSIEPGVYIPKQVGMRSEVNVYIVPGEAVVTPRDYQRDLLIV